jgi:hypothetical protein
MQQKFFIKPFAVAGDREAVPNDIQTTGDVSYEQGYGYDYQRDQASDPLAKPIERNRHNAILHDITEAVQQYQVFGTPEWITAENNGGTAYSYARRARVRYQAKNTDPWDVYESLVDNNTVEPRDTTKWVKVVSAVASQEQAIAGTDNNTIMTPLRVAQATANKQPALGYTPVQQGTGIGQQPNVVKIGWSSGERLMATVDATDLGNFVFDSQLTSYATMNWVAAKYASVDYVKDRVDSRAPIRVNNGGYGYVINDSSNIITQNWNNHDRIDCYVDGKFHGAMAYTWDIEAIRKVLTTKFGSPDGRIKPDWGVGNGFVTLTVDNKGYGINMHPSDERLKENISPSNKNALNAINQVELFGFNYKENKFLDSSIRHQIGFIAQQLHSVDPTFVIGTPDGDMMMSPNLLPIVAHLVKAVQELSAEVKQLRSASIAD